jgi:hypothetical protein
MPWNENLFKVDAKSPELSGDAKELFHAVMAQGLFLCKRAQPDIAPGTAFLLTRVQNPTEEDWQKLVKLMHFLKSTANDMLTLKADSSKIVKWYADASFAMHPDFQSHTVAVMKMGYGAITSISRKQGMNTRSLTEAKVVGADEVVGALLWTKLFLQAQGYPVADNILYQDNCSAILLDEYGQQSRSRHLDICLFLIKDQKEKGNLSIQYCPSDHMIKCLRCFVK